MRVALILGHPRADSLCAAIADAYARGATQAGVELRRIDLHTLDFNPDVTAVSPRDQTIEPDIQKAIALIAWAEHIVFVFPTWWGTMPAVLKGFLDRVLLPGFAFAHRSDGHGWDKLLTGRSAHLLTTMDTPSFVYRWIYGAPGLRAISRATLGFCGIRTVAWRIFGPVMNSTAVRRLAWLQSAEAMGAALKHGVYSPRQRWLTGIGAWIAALRLQFHPMAWAAYALGARAAAGNWQILETASFWIGLAALFTLEAATVLSNERFDWESDRRNRNYSPFNGGSRVLVDKRIRASSLLMGVAVALLFYLVAAFWLIIYHAELWPWLALAPALGLGYTSPPLRLCWRGLGEIDVAFTHSALVIMFGYVLFGGRWTDPWPWLISVPLFCAVFTAIIMSGLPDAEADQAAGKRTLAVRLGRRGTVQLAACFTVGAVLMAIVTWSLTLPARPILFLLALGGLLHGALRLRALARLKRQCPGGGRIDKQMRGALAFILWFVVVPLIVI
jgi:1,4-dihydroxy-2-naphthoate polyprenyltransferase